MMTPEEFIGIAMRKAELELQQTGGWIIRPGPQADPVVTTLVSQKTLARMAELDQMLGLSGRHRIAEAMLQDLIRDISKDRTSLILIGWDFEDPERAAADLRALGARWAREDRKSSKDGKEGK